MSQIQTFVSDRPTSAGDTVDSPSNSNGGSCVAQQAVRGRRQTPKSLTSDDLVNMRKAIESFHFDPGLSRSLFSTWQHLLETSYTYVDAEGLEHVLSATDCPSYRQLTRFFHQNYPDRALRKRRRQGYWYPATDDQTESSTEERT